MCYCFGLMLSNVAIKGFRLSKALLVLVYICFSTEVYTQSNMVVVCVFFLKELKLHLKVYFYILAEIGIVSAICEVKLKHH